MTQVSAEKTRMLPPWRNTAIDIGDHPSLGRSLAAETVSPSRIKKIAPHFCDSSTTIARTARTSVSATARATGSPFAQRCREKDRANLQDQQDRQARVSNPILPSID